MNSGEWVWVSGANGVGKSTLLRVLAGLKPFAQGECFWKGSPIDLASKDHRRRVAYLGNRRGLWNDATVSQHLTSSVVQKFWGLDALCDVPVKFLSQGQQQRLALALVVTENRPLWLLDEPTQHLDAEGKEVFEKSLEAHLQAGGIAFIATHEEVAPCANHRLVLK